jgi:CheY-like chemotaxis protein
MRLPLVAPPWPPAVAEEPEPTSASRSPHCIVIVEDNPSVAAALAEAIEQAGHTVHVFGDGPSVLAGVSGLKPDVFLIDIGLPGMDGYELATKLKEFENTKDALRVAVSGLRRRERVRQDGDEFHHYFNKPVDLPRLLALFDQLDSPRTMRPR